MSTVNINFHAGTRSNGVRAKARKHTLQKCTSTGLARYRDRHQARDGARALASGSQHQDVSTFACPDCRGWHVEKNDACEPIPSASAAEPTNAYSESLGSRKRRYFLVDVENPTRGAKSTCEEVATLWRILKQQAPGIAPEDHVVVGASRRVARKYRAVIRGANVRWVVGADAPDAADRALLAAIDLHRVARDYDELVIVSGDHAFAPLARRAKRFGLRVRVVTAEHPEQRTMLSRELAAIADTRTLVRLERRVTGPKIHTSFQGAKPRAVRFAPIQPVAA